MISQVSSKALERPDYKILHCNQDFSGNSAGRGLFSTFLYKIFRSTNLKICTVCHAGDCVSEFQDNGGPSSTAIHIALSEGSAVAPEMKGDSGLWDLPG